MNSGLLTNTKRRLARKWWNSKQHELLVLKGLVNSAVYDDHEFLGLYNSLHSEGRITLTFREQWNLYNFSKRAACLDGNFAEVGVYRGGSAKLLCHTKGNKCLHLFDTFEGMPNTVTPSIDIHRPGDFDHTSLGDVKVYLSSYDDLVFHEGFFPSTAITAQLQSQAFCLVHIDVDIYQSTLDSLRFFYPLLTPGGIILSHDYGSRACPGVRLAFTEFFAEKSEPVIPLWDTQALVIKNVTGKG